MELALGVMKSPGAGPSVRTSKDPFGTNAGVDALKFTCQEVKEFVPLHLDEGVYATTC